MWDEPFNASVFEQSAEFDPAGDFEAFARAVPAKWVVYLLADADDRPIQLLCVKNLRYSLKRRLGTEQEIAAPSRRINYRDFVRRVHWRRVDSAFEADLVYFEAARRLFPQTYRGMVGFRPAWFIHVNPEANFPRYTKTVDLTVAAGRLIGPLEDKHVAARLIQLAEDAFDLCRYYNILVEAPHGRACAYKEMGKCPAPCDGSISIEQYRRMLAWSAETIVDPDAFLRDQTMRMRQAAAALKFETAARIKAYIDSLSALGKGPFRHARRLADFAYLSLQQGPREGTAKAFLISPGRVRAIASLIAEPARPADLLRLALTLDQERDADPIDRVGCERIGVVSHHLFAAKGAGGQFLPLASIDEKSIVKAYRDLRKQRREAEVEAEGVMKELQSLAPGEHLPEPEDSEADAAEA